MTQRLIALYSPAMGSGKTTVADHLVTHHGFRRIAFATPLKRMALEFLTATGLTYPDAMERVYGDRKEAPIPGLDLTSRRLQQYLGTEFGRDCIGDTVWVDIAMAAVRASPDPVVIDDMRFRNEYDAVLAAGGECWRVERPGTSVTASHVSEGALNGVWMRQLINDSSIAYLGNLVDLILAHA